MGGVGERGERASVGESMDCAGDADVHPIYSASYTSCCACCSVCLLREQLRELLRELLREMAR